MAGPVRRKCAKGTLKVRRICPHAHLGNCPSLGSLGLTRPPNAICIWRGLLAFWHLLSVNTGAVPNITGHPFGRKCFLVNGLRNKRLGLRMTSQCDPEAPFCPVYNASAVAPDSCILAPHYPVSCHERAFRVLFGALADPSCQNTPERAVAGQPLHSPLPGQNARLRW
jgi:hypothetical protein